MTYRSKISIGLIALALTTNRVLLALMYVQARDRLIVQMRSTVLPRTLCLP